MSRRIGTENESGLHAALKRWFAQPGDDLEVEVEGYVIDIVRGDQLLEVQTGGFSGIRAKLEALLPTHSIELIHPIAAQKWLVQLDPDTGARLRRRKSPKRGTLLDLFDELLRIPHLVDHPHFTLTIALTREEELRCADGQGSWRRQRVSIVGHELLDVLETTSFYGHQDYVALLPSDLASSFTTSDLAAASSLRLRQAQRATYALHKMGALRRIGRRGRAWLYEKAQP